MITLALSKGRILDETLPLLAAAGIALAEDPEASRKLIVATSRPDLRIVPLRGNVQTRLGKVAADAVTLHDRLPDGHMGFPGALDVTVRYAITAGPVLGIEVTAVTDA